ncbi:unnamed protein product [Calicophoron daubneyi]|uniref:C2 domain-containing protein n=1 Tax=Calicophoron daubneyi TaxID=300641 RepID=A0AAV2TS73_CALDB
MDPKGSIGTWSRDVLEDQYQRIYDDFLILKKHACKQEEKIKQMATKILRLASDKGAGNGTNFRENEFNEKIENLERKNAALQQKLLLTQNQLSVKRQRIGSAPNTARSNSHRNLRTLGTPADRAKESAATGALQTARMQNAALEQTIKQLSEHSQEQEHVIGQLREEMLTKQANYEREIQSLTDRLSSRQKDTLKENIDIIRNQRELREKQLKVSTLESQIQESTAAQEATKAANRQLITEVERLTREIGVLEQRIAGFESKTNSASTDRLKVLELQNSLDDYKRENEVLKESNEKLMSNAFSGMNEQAWLRQEQKLRAHISHLESVLQKRTSISATASNAQNTTLEAVVRAKKTEVEAAELPQRLQTSAHPTSIPGAQAESIARATGFTTDELEEALMILRERKAKAAKSQDGLEFLEKTKDAENKDSAKRLQESEAAHAETIAELEKTRKILAVQYRINKDYRAEATELAERLTQVKDETDQRLAEYAKLLDIRGARIKQLEGQLQDMAYGAKQKKSFSPRNYELIGDQPMMGDDLIDFTDATGRGENIIEVHVGQLVLTSAAAERCALADQQNPQTANSLPTNMKQLRLFITWDFFDFETQATPVINGTNADFNLTVQYPVKMDDLLLEYLSKGQCTVELHQALDGRYRTIGAGQLDVSSLLQIPDGDEVVLSQDETAMRRIGQINLIGVVGNGPVPGIHELTGMPVGRLDYWVRLCVPMPQAIRLYKERFKRIPHPLRTSKRTIAHETAKLFASLPERPSGVDPSSNQLHIHVKEVTDLQSRRPECQPSPFFAYQFYDQPEYASAVIETKSSANFDDLKTFSVTMDQRLDQYLRSQSLRIYVLDNADPNPAASCIGVATVPLLGLVTRSSGVIEGLFELCSPDQIELNENPQKPGNTQNTIKKGLASVKIYWQYPYVYGKASSISAPEPVTKQARKDPQPVVKKIEDTIEERKKEPAQNQIVGEETLEEVKREGIQATATKKKSPPMKAPKTKESGKVESPKPKIPVQPKCDQNPESPRLSKKSPEYWARVESARKDLETVDDSDKNSQDEMPKIAGTVNAAPSRTKTPEYWERMESARLDLESLDVPDEPQETKKKDAAKSKAADAIEKSEIVQPAEASPRSTQKEPVNKPQKPLKGIMKNIAKPKMTSNSEESPANSPLTAIDSPRKRRQTDMSALTVPGAEMKDGEEPQQLQVSISPRPNTNNSAVVVTPTPLPRKKSAEKESTRRSKSPGGKSTTKPSPRIKPKKLGLSRTKLATDENQVRVDLHDIEINSSFYKLKNSKVQKLFVEYTFLGYPDPLETESSILVGRSGRKMKAELNYSTTFDVDFAKNYERRQHLARLLLPEDPNQGNLVFTIVAEPYPSESGECEEIGTAKVNIRQILASGKDLDHSVLKIEPIRAENKPVASSEQVGQLCVSIYCLSALKAIVKEMPGTKLAV